MQRFHNLDGLRFLAAFVVVISHIEGIKRAMGLSYVSTVFIQTGAQLAVTFFFVLSGFLIAWLLLKEKEARADNRINLRSFYKKRILRIWPLYYLLIVVAFLVLGRLDFFTVNYGLHNEYGSSIYWKKFAGHLLFLPNVTGLRYGGFVYVAHTWSLGVEEFFYLFFPIVIYFIRQKRIALFLIIICLLSLAFYTTLSIRFTNRQYINPYLLSAAFSYRLYCFALGALAALLFLRQHWLQHRFFTLLLKNKIVITIGIIVLLVLVITGFTFSHITQFVYSVLFAWLILAVTLTGMKLWFINLPFIQYLGKISYGIYMLHPIAIVTTLKLVLLWTNYREGIVFNILVYTITTGLTIGLAILSYELYEKFFLRYARKR